MNKSMVVHLAVLMAAMYLSGFACGVYADRPMVGLLSVGMAFIGGNTASRIYRKVKP